MTTFNFIKKLGLGLVAVFAFQGCNVGKNSAVDPSYLQGKPFGITSLTLVDGKPLLVWNNYTGAAKYLVQRGTPGVRDNRATCTNLVLIATVTSDVTTYHDTSATGGTAYCYEVAAANEAATPIASAQDLTATGDGASDTPPSITPTLTTSLPTIGSLAPLKGLPAGGTSITITGTSFIDGATVTVGGTACTSVVVLSATSISCTTPAHAAGAVDVVVTNTDGGVITSAAAFTYDGTGPVVESVTPATAAVGAYPTSVVVTLDEATDAASVANGDLVITGTCSPLPSPAVTGGGTDTLTFALSGGTCTNGQTVIATFTPSAVDDSLGNAGTGIAVVRTFTVDTLGPTVSTITPATATVGAKPASVVVTLSQATAASSVSAGDLVITGTCSPLPTTSVGGAGTTVLTFSLIGGTCANGQTVIATFTPSDVTDEVGNAATGAAVVRTFTIDSVGPTVASVTPATASLNAIPAVVVTMDTATGASSVANGDLAITGTCGTLPTPSVSGGGTTALTFTLAGGVCLENQTVIATFTPSNVTDEYGNPGTGAAVVRTFTIDTVAPLVSTVTPASGSMSTPPASVVVTMDSLTAASSVANGDLVITGTCATPPTPSVSGAGTAVLTFTLSGAVCNDLETVIATFTPSSVTDVLGNAGSGAAVVRTYVVSSAGPTLVSQTPATGAFGPIPASVIVTLDEAASVASAENSDLVLTGTCTALPTAVVTGGGTNTLTFTLTGGTCTDGQTIIATFTPSSINDLDGNPGTGAASVTTYTKDAVGPTVSSVTPATATVGTIPGSVVVTMDTAIAGSSAANGDLVITGTCSPLPSPTVSGGGTTALTFTLAGGTCTDGQTVIATFTPSSVTDLYGNAGTGVAVVRTFTADTVGPVVSSISPVTGTVGTIPASVIVTMDSATAGSSVVDGDLVITGSCSPLPSPTVSGGGTTTLTFTLAGGTCTNGQTVTATFTPSSVTDAYGNAGTGAAVFSTFTADTVGPTVSSVTPATSTVGTLPVSVVVTMDTATAGSSVVDGDLVITGTCSPLPTATVSGGGTAALTFTFVGGTCTDGQTTIATFTPSDVTDAYGNAGTGAAVVRTFTFDLVGPTVSTVTPATGTVGAIPASVVVTLDSAAANSSVANGDLVITGTCSPLPSPTVSGGGTTTLTFTLAGGTCANGQTVIATFTPSTVTDVTGNAGTGAAEVRTYTMDSVGPTFVSMTPADATLTAIPAAVVVTMDTAVKGTSLVDADLAITGTCSPLPTATASGGGTAVLTFTLTGGTCTEGQTVIATFTPSNVTDLSDNAGTGGAEVRTFTIDSVGPAFSMMTPASGPIGTIPAAVVVTFASAPDAATVADGDLAITGTCTLPTPTVSGQGTTTLTFTLAGGSCTTGQTVIATFDPANVADALGNVGTGGSQGHTFTFDDVGPTVASMLPGDGMVGAIPAAVTVTFNEDIDASTIQDGDLTIGGTCATPPTVSAAAGGANSIVFTLVGGTCNDTEVLTATFNTSSVQDVVGNAGANADTMVTYTLSIGPLVTNLSPASGPVAKLPTEVELGFSRPVLAESVALSDLKIHSTCSAAPRVERAASTDSKKHVFTLNNLGVACANGQTITYSIDDASITDVDGKTGKAGTLISRTLTWDDKAPVAVAMTPSSGAFGAAGPEFVAVRFDEPVLKSSVKTAALVIDKSSTCSRLPRVTNHRVMGSDISFKLSQDMSCADGETLVLKLDGASVTDLASNPGRSQVVATYVHEKAYRGMSLANQDFPGKAFSGTARLPFAYSNLSDPNWKLAKADWFGTAGSCARVTGIDPNSEGFFLNLDLAGCSDNEVGKVAFHQPFDASRRPEELLGSILPLRSDKQGPMVLMPDADNQPVAVLSDILFSYDTAIKKAAPGTFRAVGTGACAKELPVKFFYSARETVKVGSVKVDTSTCNSGDRYELRFIGSEVKDKAGNSGVASARSYFAP